MVQICYPFSVCLEAISRALARAASGRMVNIERAILPPEVLLPWTNVCSAAAVLGDDSTWSWVTVQGQGEGRGISGRMRRGRSSPLGLPGTTRVCTCHTGGGTSHKEKTEKRSHHADSDDQEPQGVVSITQGRRGLADTGRPPPPGSVRHAGRRPRYPCSFTAPRLSPPVRLCS